jgi:hypothetical protein
MKHYREMLELLEKLQEQIDDAPEAEYNTESVIRIELANILARARVLLVALADDGELWGQNDQD